MSGPRVLRHPREALATSGLSVAVRQQAPTTRTKSPPPVTFRQLMTVPITEVEHTLTTSLRAEWTDRFLLDTPELTHVPRALS